MSFSVCGAMLYSIIKTLHVNVSADLGGTDEPDRKLCGTPDLSQQDTYHNLTKKLHLAGENEVYREGRFMAKK